MFGKSEGGELLDMTDDGFDDVAPVEQSLVEERHREAFHVAPDPRHQDKAAAEQFVREILADVAFVAEQFPDQLAGQLWHRRGVMDVAGRQRERDDLTLMVEHQMELEAEEPADAGLAAPGQAGKHLMAVDATRVTHRQGHGDSVLELLHVPRQKFNRLICSRACILVAAEICWRWSRRAWHAWCTNLSETLYEYIYGRSIYTPDSGSMVSDIRRVRGRLHRSASPEDWTQASAL